MVLVRFFFIVIYAVCSDGEWDNNYSSNFAPETFVDKSYEPLFLSGNMFYGDDQYDDNHISRFNDAIVKDWKGYLGNSMAEKEIKPRTYTEQKEAKRYMILTLNCEVLGIWGNLKKLCSDIKANDLEFPSYWTIIRKDENPIKITTSKGEYILSAEKPK